MRSAYPNLLSLTEWAVYMGLDPWVVAGFCNTPVVYNHSTSKCCDGVWSEFLYQRNQLARTDVSLAIMAAEEMFATNIGYWPAPKAIVDELRRYPWGDNPLQEGSMKTKQGVYKSVQLRYGRILDLGREVYTQLDAEAALTPTYDMGYITTQNELPVPDHFTLTITLPDGMIPDEIRLYHTAANRLNEPRDQWQIRPINVSMSGQIATITGDAWLFGRPQLLVDITTNCLDATDIEGSFVAEVEVWRCSLDRSQQGNFVWEDDGCTSTPCDEVRRPFCASIRLENCSYIVPRFATFDEESGTFKWSDGCPPANPRDLKVNYRSGIPLSNFRMEPLHGRVIAMLASSLLDCGICACDCTKDRLEGYAQYEMVVKDEGIGNVKSFERIKNAKTADNPFGERYGQLQAWMVARNWKVCR